MSLRRHDDWLTINSEHETYQSQLLPLHSHHTRTHTHTHLPTYTHKVTKRAVGWGEDGDRGSPLQMWGCNCISCPVGRGWAWIALKWTQSGGHIKPLVALQPSASLLRRISYAAFLQRLTELWGVNGNSHLLILCCWMSFCGVWDTDFSRAVKCYYTKSWSVSLPLWEEKTLNIGNHEIQDHFQQ